MDTRSSFESLSDEALLAKVMRLARRERHATARLIASLAELDGRRLYLGQGCSSMFAYCTRVLHLSEHAAYGRIEAARLARRFPVILERLEDGAVTLTTLGLLADIEKKKLAATEHPRTGGGTRLDSRHIPASVKREVWQRDGGRCAFVGTQGRCEERGFVEFHHLEPYAAGGRADAANLELRCRVHNAYEAELCFGERPPGGVREDRLVWRVETRSGPSWRRGVRSPERRAAQWRTAIAMSRGVGEGKPGHA